MRNNYRDVGNIPDITKVVPVSQGGFGGKNNIESAKALDVLRKSDVGQLIAPVPTQDNPLEIEGPDFTKPLLKGPSFIVQGLPFRYTILNPKPVGQNTVSISEGSAALDGFDIVGTATSSLGSCMMTVNGREISIPVHEAKPMSPVLTCVHDGKATGSSLIPMAIDGIKTSGYVDTLMDTEYQCSDDKNFSRLLSKENTHSGSLTYTQEAPKRGLTLFFRARIKGRIGSFSDWSNIVSVTIETAKKVTTSFAKIPKLSSYDAQHASYNGNSFIHEKRNRLMVTLGIPSDGDFSRVVRKIYFPNQKDLTDIRSVTATLPSFPGKVGFYSTIFALSDAKYGLETAIIEVTPGSTGATWFRSVRLDGESNPVKFGELSAPINLSGTMNNTSFVGRFNKDASQIHLIYYNPFGNSISYTKIVRIDQETGQISIQQSWTSPSSPDLIYSGMGSLMSPDGLTVMEFDTVQTGTKVRTYTRPNQDAQFVYRDTRVFSNRFTSYGTLIFDSSGTYFTYVSAPTNNFGAGMKLQLFKMTRDATNYPTWTLVDEIASPDSGYWDTKVVVAASFPDVVYFNEQVYMQEGTFGYTKGFYIGNGKLEVQSWMEPSMASDRIIRPLLMRSGKMLIYSDGGDNYNISI